MLRNKKFSKFSILETRQSKFAFSLFQKRLHTVFLFTFVRHTYTSNKRIKSNSFAENGKREIKVISFRRVVESSESKRSILVYCTLQGETDIAREVSHSFYNKVTKGKNSQCWSRVSEGKRKSNGGTSKGE